MTDINTYLGTTLDISLRDDEHIMIMDPFELAQTPVGDADLTEWGWLNGAYLNCVFTNTAAPEDIIQTYIDQEEGKPPGATTAWSGRPPTRATQRATSSSRSMRSESPASASAGDDGCTGSRRANDHGSRGADHGSTADPDAGASDDGAGCVLGGGTQRCR